MSDKYTRLGQLEGKFGVPARQCKILSGQQSQIYFLLGIDNDVAKVILNLQ